MSKIPNLNDQDEENLKKKVEEIKEYLNGLILKYKTHTNAKITELLEIILKGVDLKYEFIKQLHASLKKCGKGEDCEADKKNIVRYTRRIEKIPETIKKREKQWDIKSAVKSAVKPAVKPDESDTAMWIGGRRKKRRKSRRRKSKKKKRRTRKYLTKKQTARL